MSENTKDWIKLVALIFATGAGITITTYLGGAKLWIAILAGMGAAGTNVYHALNEKPGDRPPVSPESIASNIERKENKPTA